MKHLVARRGLLPVLGAFLALSLLHSTSACAEMRKLALLIGIDDYLVVNDLRGTVNDVRMVREMLVGQYAFAEADVVTLTNSAATHAAIVNAIRTQLIARARPGDIVVIHFSGHGSQMRDEVGGDEIDGWDETLVAYDSRSPGVFDVSDDEVNALLRELGAKTDNVVVILDSCHSGSATRLADAAVRSIKPDLRPPPPGPVEGDAARGIVDDSTDFRARGSNYVLISGSRPDELSNETILGGQVDGALTYFLVNTLRTSARRLTYRDAMAAVSAEVSARFPTQHPTLEGPGFDNVVFGTERVASRVPVDVVPRGNGVDIDGGITVGLSPGARLDIFAIGAAPGAARIAAVEVVTATPFKSTGKILSGAVTARARGIITHSAFGSFRTNVWIEPGASPETLAALRTEFGTETLVREVAEENSATLRIVRRNAAWELQSIDKVALSPPVPVNSPDAVRRLAEQVSLWARWYAVRELKNPGAALDVAFDMKRMESPDYSSPPAELPVGAQLVMKITNRSTVPLFVAVIDIASSGSVNVIYPRPGTLGNQESLPAGKDVEINGSLVLPVGRDSETDTLKLIAATQAFDARVYAMDPMRAREVSTTPVDDWVTQQRTLRVVRPSARSTGIALLFDQPVTSDSVTRSIAIGTRDVCPVDGPPTGNCVRVAPLSSDATVVEVQTSQSRGDVTTPTSTALAYEEAYELLATSGAKRAEPLLDVPMPHAEETTVVGARGGDSAPPDPLTDDEQWSLKYVRAPQAQNLVRTALNRPAGEEAKGVRIAHPDTGFTEHPETRPAVLAQAGHDYVDSDGDATDPLIEEDPLDNPGHGTGSGSVIVSPNGRQLPGAGKGIFGVAPGAELVPLRVNNSVVFVFSGKRVSQAIDQAANGKLGAEVALISLAMGGPPSWTLHHAVKEAKKKGVLLISAAGNYVGTVVWPARFDDAIAVSAIGVRCEPWSHASKGSAVDISAPGESVWRAQVTKPAVFDVGRGSGTTFATGTTAGVAALWVARYENTAEFKALKNSGRLTDAFRAALQDTSWQPNGPNDPSKGACKNASWKPKLYGRGIVNAERLLANPPAPAATRGLEAERSLEQLPLFSTLYAEGTAYPVVESDYLKIFGGPTKASIRQVGIFENEILYHYTVDPDVASAVDTLIAKDGGSAAAGRVTSLLRSRDISRSLRKALN